MSLTHGPDWLKNGVGRGIGTEPLEQNMARNLPAEINQHEGARSETLFTPKQPQFHARGVKNAIAARTDDSQWPFAILNLVQALELTLKELKESALVLAKTRVAELAPTLSALRLTRSSLRDIGNLHLTHQ